MDEAPHIAVEKDPALNGALELAAAVNEPGMSEAALLRYLALVGAANLPEPHRPPTPEQLQRAIDLLTKNPPWDREVLDAMEEVAWRNEGKCVRD